MNKKLQLKLLLILLFTIFFIQFQLNNLYPDYRIHGYIESVRENRYITVLFSKKPDKYEYIILENKKEIGVLRIITLVNNDDSINRYRALGKYSLNDKKHSGIIRAGSEIALTYFEEKFKMNYDQKYFDEKIIYRKSLYSRIDNREMLLVPSGKFLMGSNSGERDEYPEHVIFLNDYYIDKFEVSNRDYKKYVKEQNVAFPSSWESGTIDSKGNFINSLTADLPVLVSYHEAVSYAVWAGKQLPSEGEWVKAARGGIDEEQNKAFIYPWGNKFKPEKVNSDDFWSDKDRMEEIRLLINKKYNIETITKGRMPVDFFSDGDLSPFGMVNMGGNVKEWTSDWYDRFNGNTSSNSKFGMQYKVVKGGAWYSESREVRVLNRNIGGIPNLYKDNISGFRCVRDVSILDIIE